MTALVIRGEHGGIIAGCDPRKLPRAALEEVHTPAPMLSVIRAKWLDCCVDQISEVAKCSAVRCALWPYRMGTNPFNNRKGNPDGLRRARSRKSSVQAGILEKVAAAGTELAPGPAASTGG